MPQIAAEQPAAHNKPTKHFVIKIIMKSLRRILFALALTACSIIVESCISDAFTTSSSDVLAFSVDTLKFDTVITAQGSPTKQFIIYNHAKKNINISSIRIAQESEGHFFLNVDGVKGDEFHNIEIMGGDSIYVFVESLLDPTGEDEPIWLKDKIFFETNGVTQQVVLTAWSQDVERLADVEITTDTHLTANKPYVIYDSLVVSPKATLYIDEGATLLFHDKAKLKVEGRLLVNGTQKNPVNFRGDRLDHVVGKIGFDIMSGQWDGVEFMPGSIGNEIRYLLMRGTRWGMWVEAENANERTLLIHNSVLHNSSNSVFTSINAWVEATGTEFSDGSQAVVDFYGGKVWLAQCTMANYYLFSSIDRPLVNFNVPKDNPNCLYCQLDNCIIYGNAADVDMGKLDGTQVYLRNCLLKSNGVDDANFINCVWAGDPLFYTVREDYIFDYRLRNSSGAIAMGNRDLCPESARYDRYGNDRFVREGVDLGAYTWVPAEE